MKSILALLLCTFTLQGSAQYYYKDIIGTRETTATMRTYMSNKVSRVMLTSYDADNTKSDNFFVMQEFQAAARTLTTTTKNGDAEASVLLSWIDGNGNVIRTLDSSSFLVSNTNYYYDEKGNLVSLKTNSQDSGRRSLQSEEHIWQYQDQQVKRMIKIKNGTDTSFVELKTDDRGNIIEEVETRKGIQKDPVYYYYDRNNRLTDIVRFSPKAQRLLPEYMFEYSPAGQVIQKITVPANSDKYLIWRYQFNAEGLKVKEAIYDKQKSLVGKVEYQYSFTN